MMSLLPPPPTFKMSKNGYAQPCLHDGLLTGLSLGVFLFQFGGYNYFAKCVKMLFYLLKMPSGSMATSPVSLKEHHELCRLQKPP